MGWAQDAAGLVETKPFFSGLDTLPHEGGGGCLPAFFEILGAPSGITPPPPPVGVGQEWVLIFWEKHLQPKYSCRP